MDKEKYMKNLWIKYNKSKNINYLQKACENAPFFGSPEMGKEISKLLGELEILKKGSILYEYKTGPYKGTNKDLKYLKS